MDQQGNRVPSLTPLTVDESYVVKSDETMISIIEYIQQVETAGVSEIADEVGIAKSAVYKHLITLKNHGFLHSVDEGYRIGLRFLEIGLRKRRNRPLYPIAKPKIEEVANETGKLTWCAVEENGLGVFFCGAEGDHAVNTDGIPGRRMHMHYLSGGKAMLAHMSQEKVREIIDRYGLPPKTEHTITDEDELFDELRQIRDQGYALAFEESLRGFHTVSAPVLTQSGLPIAAVIIAGAAQRMGLETCNNELAEVALAAANEIGLDLQYRINSETMESVNFEG